MTRGIQRLLRVALRNVQAEITVNAQSGSMFARGLAGEGYAGGYRDALMDVRLALNGGMPSTRRYWVAPPDENGTV